MSESSSVAGNPQPSAAPPPTTTSGGGGSKSTKKGKKKERTGRRNREICDVFGESAMINAYNISHNVQDFLNYRGFPWAGHKK